MFIPSDPSSEFAFLDDQEKPIEIDFNDLGLLHQNSQPSLDSSFEGGDPCSQFVSPEESAFADNAPASPNYTSDPAPPSPAKRKRRDDDDGDDGAGGYKAQHKRREA